MWAAATQSKNFAVNLPCDGVKRTRGSVALVFFLLFDDLTMQVAYLIQYIVFTYALYRYSKFYDV